MSAMRTKLSILLDAAAAGDWRKAISVASKFHDLGAHKADISRAQMAYTNPRFVVQIGKDVSSCIEAGKSALIVRYSIKH